MTDAPLFTAGRRGASQRGGEHGVRAAVSARSDCQLPPGGRSAVSTSARQSAGRRAVYTGTVYTGTQDATLSIGLVSHFDRVVCVCVMVCVGGGGEAAVLSLTPLRELTAAVVV